MDNPAQAKIHSICRGILFAVCLGLTTLAAAADHLGQLKLSTQPTDLLDGRLTVRVPEQGQPTPIQHDIMGAPESNAEMSRIQIDAGAERMVLLAQELFARTGAEFEKVVKKKCSELPTRVTIEPWPLSSKLRAYACIPVEPGKNKQANLVFGLYVAQEDGTVQELAFFANQPEGANFADASALARSISATIVPGKKQLNSAAGDRKLGTRNLIITVPDGYVATEQRGVDFVVYHLRKITPFSDPSASIGIYLGDWPPKNDATAKKNGSISLFGRQADWYEQIGKDGQLFDRALFKFASLGSIPSSVDVFLQAGDHAGIDELKKVAGTLRFGDSTKTTH